MRRKKSVFDKQYGFNLSDIQIQNPNHMSNGKKHKRSIVKNSKKLDKKEKKSRRNYMRINNSKAFDIKLNNDGDERTTLMIKNIPNKYTQDLLLQDIDQKFENAYDFFYLPIDFEVSLKHK